MTTHRKRIRLSTAERKSEKFKKKIQENFASQTTQVKFGFGSKLLRHHLWTSQLPFFPYTHSNTHTHTHGTQTSGKRQSTTRQAKQLHPPTRETIPSHLHPLPQLVPLHLPHSSLSHSLGACSPSHGSIQTWRYTRPSNQQQNTATKNIHNPQRMNPNDYFCSATSRFTFEISEKFLYNYWMDAIV